MRYTNHRLNLERLAKILKSGKRVSKKLTGTALLRVSAANYSQDAPLHTHTLDYLIQSEEWWWVNSGMLMYYIENENVGNGIFGAKTSIKNPAAFFDSNEVFVLNFPVGFEIGGVQAASCLITICRHSERMETILEPFAQVTNTTDVYKLGRDKRRDFTLMCCYQDYQGMPEEYVRFSCPVNELAILPHFEDHAAWRRHLNTLGTYKNIPGHVNLTDQDEKYQFELTRFISNFLLYRKSCPERIYEGLPGVKAKDVETPNLQNRTHNVVTGPSQGNRSSSSHYVSWHFRQLTNERYYRGEHSKCTPGSRVVFVSDYFTGKKPETYTVEGT